MAAEIVWAPIYCFWMLSTQGMLMLVMQCSFLQVPEEIRDSLMLQLHQ